MADIFNVIMLTNTSVAVMLLEIINQKRSDRRWGVKK